MYYIISYVSVMNNKQIYVYQDYQNYYQYTKYC